MSAAPAPASGDSLFHRPQHVTESPGRTERRLGLSSGDAAPHHPHHVEGHANSQREAAQQARRHSSEGVKASAGAGEEGAATVVLSEAKLGAAAGGKSVLITQTLPVEESPRGAAAAAAPASAQSAGAKPGLSSTSTAAVIPPVVKEEDKLAPPAKVLSAPLDTMRPEGADAPAAAAAPTNGSEGDQGARPHAVEQWDSIASHLKGKQTVVFLDYDGTLTPIVSEPSAALINAEQRKRLAELAAVVPVSIVTGRKVDTIKDFLLGAKAAGGPLPSLEKITFAGSHGFDISCGEHSKKVAEEYLPMLRAFHAECERESAGISGALCEDNTFSISIHYRNVKDDAQVQRIEEIVTKAVAPFEAKGQLKRHRGKCVHEIKPNVEWHKGAAVDYLLHMLYPTLQKREKGASGPLLLQDGTELAPVYVGDDTTDEDAFRVFQAWGSSTGKPALSVFVRTDDKARATAANFVVRDPNEVGQLLHKIATAQQK